MTRSVSDRRTRIFPLVAALFCSILSVLLPAPSAAHVVLTETLLTPWGGDKWSPRISGEQIVFVNDVSFYDEIYYLDSLGAAHIVNPDYESQYDPDLDGTRIAYYDWPDGSSGYRVWVYDIVTAEFTLLSFGCDAWNPAVSGDWVAYQSDCGGNRDIGAINVETWESRLMAQTLAYERNPDIDGDVVVWSVYSGGNDNVRGSSLDWDTFTVAASPAEEHSPAVSGRRVAYVSDGHIEVFDLDTGARVRLTEGEADSIDAPRIDGRYVVWADNRSGYFDVYVCDLVDTSVNLLTPEPHAQRVPDIDSHAVVYSDHRAGYWNIFRVDFQIIREHAAVVSVADILDDQGRLVEIEWRRSGYDSLGSTQPIRAYAVYREVDHELAKGGIPRVTDPAGETITDPLSKQQKAQSFPPGDWDFVSIVPATRADAYRDTVPTLADSTVSGGMYTSSFLVCALTTTTGLAYPSAPISGYSVDNAAPAAPTDASVAYQGASGNRLWWNRSADEDFRYFRVYRDSGAVFARAPGVLVQVTIDTTWTDESAAGAAPSYWVTALDFSGNESEPALTTPASYVPGGPVPRALALYPNVPNPFNPRTVIRFDVPENGARVALEVFDTGGRRVSTLVDRIVSAGSHTEVWDGGRDDGERAASGVYFIRLASGEKALTRKTTLLR